jgi:hypothetical protein
LVRRSYTLAQRGVKPPKRTRTSAVGRRLLLEARLLDEQPRKGSTKGALETRVEVKPGGLDEVLAGALELRLIEERDGLWHRTISLPRHLPEPPTRGGDASGRVCTVYRWPARGVPPLRVRLPTTAARKARVCDRHLLGLLYGRLPLLLHVLVARSANLGAQGAICGPRPAARVLRASSSAPAPTRPTRLF